MAEPLKVLLLGQDPDMFERPGGAPNDTRARHIGYVRELQRRRYGSEVRTVVHTRRPQGATFDSPFEGFEIYGTNSRSRIHAPIDMLRIVRRIIKSGWEPDVISCQTGYEEGLVAFLARPSRSRIQIQVHSDFYGRAFGARGLVHKIKRWGIRRAIARADHARVVSTGIRQSMVDAGDIPAERISVAPVPVVFAASTPSPDSARPVVLFVGRMTREKDLDLWCEAALLIHRERPEARFWLAGDGPDRELAARKLGKLGDAVMLPGAVTYANLAPLYAQASVFLLTSQYEGLGRVVVEAMMASVPVVSVDIVGPRDLIDDGRTGRLVPREPEALAAACLELLGDTAKARAIATAGHDWAQANYSFASVTRTLVDSWERAASLPRRLP